MNIKHGHTKFSGYSSPTYRSWVSMRQRCENTNLKAYRSYGARGIMVCGRWAKFENFLADMGERPEGMTLDRINNDGNYEPVNCRWATSEVQMSNRGAYNRVIDFNGKSQTITRWCQELGIPYFALNARLKRGWPVDRALTTPVEKRAKD